MKHMKTLAIVCLAALCCSLASCGGKSDPQAEAPPPLKVQSVAAEMTLQPTARNNLRWSPRSSTWPRGS